MKNIMKLGLLMILSLGLSLEAKNYLSNANNAVNNVTGAVNRANKKTSAVLNDITSFLKDADNGIQEIQFNVQNYETLARNLINKVTTLTSDIIDEVNVELRRQYQNQIYNLYPQLAALNADLARLANSLGVLENSVKTQIKKASSLNALSLLNPLIDRLNGSFSSLQKKIKNLKSEINASMKAIK